MLTSEQKIQKIKEFELYLQELKNRGNIEQLNQYLHQVGFYEAPATTKYHHSYESGLVEHSLNVYFNLKKLIHEFQLDYKESTLLVVALFHDLYKCDKYVKSVRNQKVYDINGSKYDSLGRYDWISSEEYVVNEERTTYGTSGFTSYMMLSQFISLTEEEIVTLMNYDCGMNDEFANKDIFKLMTKYPLMVLLHSADLIDSYCGDE